jgi:hypothetical protein
MLKLKNINNYKRFYKALNKIISKREEEINKYKPIIELLENLGALSLINMFTGEQVISQQDYDRIKLELTKFDVPINEESLFNIVNWVNNRDNTWRQRLNKLIEIQKANEISSLEQFTFNIGDSKHNLFRPSDKAPLNLTDYDISLLEAQKSKAIDLWLEYCYNNELSMYQLSYNSLKEKNLSLFDESQYNWQEVSSDYIQLVKDFYNWAFLIENSLDKSYNLIIGNDKEIYKSNCSALMFSPTKYEL